MTSRQEVHSGRGKLEDLEQEASGNGNLNQILRGCDFYLFCSSLSRQCVFLTIWSQDLHLYCTPSLAFSKILLNYDLSLLNFQLLIDIMDTFMSSFGTLGLVHALRGSHCFIQIFTTST